MSKKKRYLIGAFTTVILFVLIGIVVYIQSETFKTVLYSDGTLIIEESSRNQKENIENHGDILKEYPSFKEEEYIFNIIQKETYPFWYRERNSIKRIEVGSKIQPFSTAFWFDGVSNVEYVDMSNIDTSKVESMAYMFAGAGCLAKNFTIKGMSDWDTSNVTDMQWMFRDAGGNSETFNLEGGIDNWDVSNVEVMVYMFDSAGKNAKEWYIGDLTNWDVSNVKMISNLFSFSGINATEYNIGDLRNWNLDNADCDLLWYPFPNSIYKYGPVEKEA